MSDESATVSAMPSRAELRGRSGMLERLKEISDKIRALNNEVERLSKDCAKMRDDIAGMF
jgi:outer membrane murein-binding lipoprotein Lpp